MTTRYELPPVEDAPIWDIWLSMYQLPAMAVADETKVFETLAAGGMTDAALASQLGFDPRATRVLLDLLAALGLVSLDGSTYALTALARTYLLAESPFYWGPLLRVLGVLKPVHGSLLQALRRTGVDVVPGKPAQAWAQGSIDPEVAARVSRVMHCHSLPAAVTVAESGVFDQSRRILDVGGGSGCFAIALAQRHPAIHCTILELPAVCAVAQGYITEGGVADRVDTRAGDMLRDAWPTGYDAVLLSNVFHDWDRVRNTDMARRALAALPSGGKIFLHEMLLDESRSVPATAGFSMLMLLSTEGRQYRLSELREILGDAGFVDVTARATYGRYSVVSATKP